MPTQVAIGGVEQIPVAPKGYRTFPILPLAQSQGRIFPYVP